MTRPRQFGLVGHHIGYSKSPAIFERIAESTGRPATFSVVDVPPEHLAETIVRLRGWDGFSVTVPYKEVFVNLVDDLDPTAARIGAVNSVAVRDGRMTGYNTDGAGFIESLAVRGEAFATALVIGNGGAARAVVTALYDRFKDITLCVCGRNREKVRGFEAGLAKILRPEAKLMTAVREECDWRRVYELVVNCTPLGGPQQFGENPVPPAYDFAGCRVCYDVIYEPAVTPFLEAAAKAGCLTVNGREMLVRQAVESYGLWNPDARLDIGLCDDILQYIKTL